MKAGSRRASPCAKYLAIPDASRPSTFFPLSSRELWGKWGRRLQCLQEFRRYKNFLQCFYLRFVFVLFYWHNFLTVIPTDIRFCCFSNKFPITKWMATLRPPRSCNQNVKNPVRDSRLQINSIPNSFLVPKNFSFLFLPFLINPGERITFGWHQE